MVPVVLKKETRAFLLTLRVLLRWNNFGDEYSGVTVRWSNLGGNYGSVLLRWGNLEDEYSGVAVR
jgi:hypothetical protein